MYMRCIHVFEDSRRNIPIQAKYSPAPPPLPHHLVSSPGLSSRPAIPPTLFSWSLHPFSQTSSVRPQAQAVKSWPTPSCPMDRVGSVLALKGECIPSALVPFCFLWLYLSLLVSFPWVSLGRVRPVYLLLLFLHVSCEWLRSPRISVSPSLA